MVPERPFFESGMELFADFCINPAVFYKRMKKGEFPHWWESLSGLADVRPEDGVPLVAQMKREVRGMPPLELTMPVADLAVGDERSNSVLEKRSDEPSRLGATEIKKPSSPRAAYRYGPISSTAPDGGS